VIELTGASVAEFLRRFEHLDGGVIQRIEVNFKEKVVELRLTAFDANRHAAPEAEGWVTLHLRLSRLSEFCFQQGVKASGVQLDDRLEVVWLNGGVFVILDPLQTRDFAQQEWTLEQVRKSRWYAGGQSLSWELLHDELDESQKLPSAGTSR
jgi:hypothetical protein